MEEKIKVPEVELSSGRKMPAIGMGTATDPLPPPETLISAFLDAVRVGYRHFDTASLYGTEESLGRAVAEAVEKGLVKSRDELFITSKVWVTHTHPDLVMPSLQSTLERLGMEYVDLYVVHWPVSLKKGAKPLGFGKEEVVELDMKGTWNAMEECHKKGLAKSIGVSNLGPAKLSQLLQHATVAPAVNQVEMSVGWQQKELMDLCKSKGVQVCAWSPLGANGAAWGTLSIMESPILKEIADAKGKSVAQVALRWIHEQGAIPIAKSFNKERMMQNLDIFNWELTKDEVSKIEQIPQQRGFSGEMFVSETGPYKTVEELWDYPFNNIS
ncbi:Protein REDOX 2 [Linum perenne]